MTTEAEPMGEVAPEIINQAIGSLDRYILNHYGRPTRRTLRERQITVFESLRDTLRGGQTEGYITLPTGIGKTVIFTEFTEALNENEILETLIVVPTKILVRQTKDKLNKFAPSLEVGTLYSDTHDITKPITITTYASLVRNIANGTLNPGLYKLLVLDEVHRSLSGKRIKAVSKFTSSIRLGFTATPVYSEERNVANLLNTEIHKMNVREAVEADLLSSFSVIVAETEVDLEEVSIKSNGDYNEEELAEAINVAGRNQAAIDLYKKLFQGQTTIAYCVSVKHAQDLANLFVGNGVEADFITGYQSKQEQGAILKKFHDGEIKVLCNADILIEGFDEPKTSVCLNLRPTHSKVVAQQRGGRVLRLDEDNPNKHAFIVDFLDKTEDPGKQPVLFAEVAEAAYIAKKRVDVDVTTPTIHRGSGGGGFIDDNSIDISGLKIIVNPQEVMRIIKEIERATEKIPVLNSLEEVNVGETNLLNLFKGNYYKVIPIANQVLVELEKDQPGTVLQRVTEKGNRPINAVHKNAYPRFVELLTIKGVELKEKILPRVGSDEIVLGMTGLSKLFKARYHKLVASVDLVLQTLNQENPGLILQKTSKAGQPIRVIPQSLYLRFVELMKENGVELAEPFPKLDQEQEIALSSHYVTSLFKRGHATVYPHISGVVKELETKHPGITFIRRSGKNIVNAIPKTMLFEFMSLMKERFDFEVGNPVTVTEFNPLEEFALLRVDLDNIFKGGYPKWHPIFAQTLAELEEHPGIVLHRITKKGNRPYRTIPLNVYAQFVELMIAKGVELK